MRNTAEPRQTGNGAPIHLIEVPSPTGSAGPSTAPGGGRRFGVGTASALVAGSVIGTGVFALPSALAVFGPISLLAFVLVTIGAVALTLAFRGLAARLPGTGGPYVYARDAFGEFAGFLIAWSYWITSAVSGRARRWPSRPLSPGSAPSSAGR